MTDHPEEQLARLKGLNAVYQALSAVELSAFSIPILLQIVVETGAKLTGAKYGALGVFDEPGARLTEFITVGLDEETTRKIGALPMGLGLLGAMTDEPGVIRLRDLTRHPKSVGFPPHHPPMKSFLGISIRAHGRKFGRLYLTEKQGAEEFSEVDAEIVTALASQAGAILETGLLIEQFKTAEARHRQLLDSTIEGIYGLDLDGVCTFINKAGAAMLGYRPEELIGRRMHSLVHHSRPNGSPYPEEKCPTERSYRHGESYHLIEDIYWRKDGPSFPARLSCAPIRNAKTMHGVVVTFFDATEHKQVELRRALDHGITRALLESATVDEANHKILQTICEILEWDWSAVWRVDKPANVLRSMTSWHAPEIGVPEFEAITRQMTFTPGVGLPGRIWSTGEPVYIPDVTRDPNFPRVPFAAQTGLRGGFAFPIRSGGDVVGVMEFFSRKPHEPTDDMIDLFLSLGSRIGQQIERKQAEEEQQESGERFRQLAENIGEVFWMTNLEKTQMLYVSPAYETVWGRTCESLYASPLSWLDTIHPDDRPRVLESARTKQTTGDYNEEYRIVRPDGSLRWIQDQAFPIRDQSGVVYRIAGIAEDITERKRAEETIVQSRDYYLKLLEEFPTPVWKSGPDAKCDYFNNSWLAFTGRTLEQELGDGWAEGVHPEDKDRCVAIYLAAFRAREPFEMEYRLRRHDGEYRSIIDIGRPYYDLDGNFGGFIGSAYDITERKWAEEKLRQSEARLNEAQRIAHIGSWELDLVRNILVWSDEVYRMFEINPAAFVATYEAFLNLVHPEDRAMVDKAYTDSLENKVPYEITHRLLMPDGRIKHVHEQCETSFDDNGAPLRSIGTVQDITEHVRTEVSLRETHARLQQAQEEERKRIAREIHDELGQQLTMLRFGLVKLAQAEQQPSAELRTQARALTQPVDTMIDTVRRIATALRPSILDDLGLATALEWLVTDFRTRTNIPCDVSLGPLPAELDDARSITLFRILQEALTNVARHAHATHVKIRLQQTGDTLVLEVKDNGQGLTEAQRTSPAAIGLFGMQERALLVGGDVTIQSRPKEDTTVTARIPL